MKNAVLLGFAAVVERGLRKISFARIEAASTNSTTQEDISATPPIGPESRSNRQSASLEVLTSKKRLFQKELEVVGTSIGLTSRNG